MITLAFGITLNYEDHFVLEDGTEITGWDLIHNKLEPALKKSTQEKKLKLFQYQPQYFCLATKTYPSSKNEIKVSIHKLYKDYQDLDKLCFQKIFQDIGFKNSDNYQPEMLILSN